MTLKKNISLAGILLLLPLIVGCLAVGRVDSGILRGRIFKHVRVPYSADFYNPPVLAIGPIDSNILRGEIFTNVRPYKSDLHNTPVTNIHANGIIIHIEEPVSGYGLYTEFNSNAIGDIAKKHGLTKVYFADVEIFNVLGIWKHEKLHIYGEKNQFSASENIVRKGGENEK